MSFDSLKSKLIYVSVVFTLTVALGGIVELAVRGEQALREVVAQNEGTPPEEAILLKQSWGKQHQLDAANDSARYMTYVEFREKPYVSPTLNIDSESRRIVPGNCNRKDAFLVLTFGGSTMYGAGVPDQYTIPAYLTGVLNRDGRCVKIINYGSSWWQSSQSLIQLLEVLKKGVRPQLVIFYDGINDINAVSFGGLPGGIDPDTENVLSRALEPDTRSAWKVVAQSSHFLQMLHHRLFPNRRKNADNEYAVPEGDRSRLAGELADIYVSNVRSVQALATEYGFKPYFFLQPCPMIAKKANTALEEAVFKDRATNREWEADFFRLSYGVIRQNAALRTNPQFFDISGIFDGMTEELYQDSEHLLPEGNRIVAEKIASVIDESVR